MTTAHVRSRGVPFVAWLIAGSGMLVFASMFGALTGLIDFFPKPAPARPTLAVPVPASTERPTRLGAGWYTQTGVLPTLVDVNGDGTRDLVGLFWRASDGDRPLHAAAYDGKTYALLWSAGPYPSQWTGTRTHLAVVGDKVIVTDSQENLRVLGLKDGEEVSTHKITGGVTETCALGRSTTQALVRGGVTTDIQVLDLARDELHDAPTQSAAPATCARRYDTCWATKEDVPCFTWGVLPRAPKEATTSASFYVARTLQAGGAFVAIGQSTPAPKGGHEAPFAVGFTKDAKVASWRSPIVAEGDEVHFGGAQVELRDDTLFAFYPTTSGPYRVVARDAKTGALRWVTTLRDSHEGSYAAAFGVDGDRVLVVLDQSVHVLDVRDGSYAVLLDASRI